MPSLTWKSSEFEPHKIPNKFINPTAKFLFIKPKTNAFYMPTPVFTGNVHWQPKPFYIEPCFVPFLLNPPLIGITALFIFHWSIE